MILADIQAYLVRYRRASLKELSDRFQVPVPALEPMIERLIRKGRVRRVEGKKCGGCTNCQPGAIEFYEWVER